MAQQKDSGAAQQHYIELDTTSRSKLRHNSDIVDRATEGAHHSTSMPIKNGHMGESDIEEIDGDDEALWHAPESTDIYDDVDLNIGTNIENLWNMHTEDQRMYDDSDILEESRFGHLSTGEEANTKPRPEGLLGWLKNIVSKIIAGITGLFSKGPKEDSNFEASAQNRADEAEGRGIIDDSTVFEELERAASKSADPMYGRHNAGANAQMGPSTMMTGNASRAVQLDAHRSAQRH